MIALAEVDASLAEIEWLRWFAGYSIEQNATALDILIRTINHHGAYARA
jgi:hypothetical protein